MSPRSRIVLRAPLSRASLVLGAGAALGFLWAFAALLQGRPSAWGAFVLAMTLALAAVLFGAGRRILVIDPEAGRWRLVRGFGTPREGRTGDLTQVRLRPRLVPDSALEDRTHHAVELDLRAGEAIPVTESEDPDEARERAEALARRLRLPLRDGHGETRPAELDLRLAERLGAGATGQRDPDRSEEAGPADRPDVRGAASASESAAPATESAAPGSEVAPAPPAPLRVAAGRLILPPAGLGGGALAAMAAALPVVAFVAGAAVLGPGRAGGSTGLAALASLGALAAGVVGAGLVHALAPRHLQVGPDGVEVRWILLGRPWRRWRAELDAVSLEDGETLALAAEGRTVTLGRQLSPVARRWLAATLRRRLSEAALAAPADLRSPEEAPT